MEIVSSLVSLTVAKVLRFSGLAANRNVLKSKKMEEKALEVYGERGPPEVIHPVSSSPRTASRTSAHGAVAFSRPPVCASVGVKCAQTCFCVVQM